MHHHVEHARQPQKAQLALMGASEAVAKVHHGWHPSSVVSPGKPDEQAVSVTEPAGGGDRTGGGGEVLRGR